MTIHGLAAHVPALGTCTAMLAIVGTRSAGTRAFEG